MATAPALRKAMPVLGKLGLWMGISALTTHLTANPELASTLATIGVAPSNLDGACKLIDGLASSRLSDYYKDFRNTGAFGINHHLQKALQDGIINALSELETTFSSQHSLSEHERRQTEYYFQSLAHHLSTAVQSDEQVDEYVLKRADFFSNLLRTAHTQSEDADQVNEGVLIPDLSDATAQQLITFLTKWIEPTAQRYINEEFKTDEKAKAAYFIHLLEYSARLNQDNNTILIEVSRVLDDVGQHQQEHTDLLQQIAQAQHLLHELLRKFHVDFRAYVNEFDAFRERVESQLEPSLRLPDYHHLNASFSYQYGLRYTSFIGRNNEIEQLWDFLNSQSDRRMLWWLITGPGGMGKNRLALEFCLQARYVNRYVGFLESQHITGFDWSQWRPAYPTLLVVDYVATHAVATQQMIAQLSRNAQNKLLTKPVRVLLLERETRDDWWGPFLADRDVFESGYMAGDPGQTLSLSPFADADRWRIITELHQKQGKTLRADKTETLRSLTEIDPEGRPLFAFLAGMALAEGEDIRHWDVHDLLANLLQREENSIWKKHPRWQDERCRDGHKNLLVLTTLTRGLTTGQLLNLFAQKLDWLPVQKPDNSLYEQLADIRQRDLPNGKKEKLYDGLQPDIVGEYYVLNRLNKLLNDDFAGEETVQSLLRMSWNISPEQTYVSIWRILNDFSHFPDINVYQCLFQIQPNAGLYDRSWEWWGNLQADLIHPGSCFLYKKLAYENQKMLVQAYFPNQIPIYQQAKGALSFTFFYNCWQDQDKAESYYSDLQTLSKLCPYNEEIVLCQAMGAFNLISNNIRAQDFYKAEIRYTDLEALANSYDHNRKIALYCAKGAYNLTNAYGSYWHWEEARIHYTNLQALSIKYLYNEEIVLYQAMGAYTLINCYAYVGRLNVVGIYYTDLLEMSKNYPMNDEIVLYQAMGAISQLLRASKLEKLKRKIYFLSLINDLIILEAKYEKNEFWQDKLPLLKETVKDNQWLKP